MRYFKVIPLALITIFLIACQSKSDTITKNQDKAAAFTKEIEDKDAAELVAIMTDAMGGKEKWDALQYVSWTFFGTRHLVWDKKNGRVRIESPKDSSIYLVDLDGPSGKYAYNGVEITEPDKLEAKIIQGKNIWINDMYWLFMPFKLQDEGVMVKHVRVDTTLIGSTSDVLELTFDNVGNTPENKYEVFIDQEDQLIKQWNFFRDAEQDTASRIWPWDNYQDFDGLLLSVDRSDKSGPSNVRVYDHLDDKVFTNFDSIDFY